MDRLIKAVHNNKAGASAAEYALIIGLVGVAIIVGATALGVAINGRLAATAPLITGAA